uniref:Uncharacterized protein n=1 Tax=Anopheles stephensi TaxID=30069 RepID=A0A182XXY3_ANOST
MALFGGNLFPADVPTDEQVFDPTLPVPEKQVLELGNLRPDIEATSVSSRNGGSSSSRSQAQSDVEHHPAAQKIYPTFFRNIPPLGHSRPYYQSTEAAIEQRFNKLRTGVPTAPEIASSPLLGSGDFGIIKGGTFYYDTDVPGKGFVDDFYGLGYSGNNGHGRPQLAYLVQKPQKEEQFSNFRDFADINISNDPAYSHHAPRYVEMHGAGGVGQPLPDIRSTLAPATVPETVSPAGTLKREPDNILDELRSLDEPPSPNGKSRPRMQENKAKKETLYERKKRPKVMKTGTKSTATEQPEGEDYMVAAS